MMGWYHHTPSPYDDDTKFGQTFRNLMRWAKEALEDKHPGTRQLRNIRRFSVPVKNGGEFTVEMHPNDHPHYSVHQGGRQIHTDMFNDMLTPVLEAIQNAGLSDVCSKYPNSVLKQATEEEHGFSHMLNGG